MMVAIIFKQVALEIVAIEQIRHNAIAATIGLPKIHLADTDVLIVAMDRNFQEPVLTDDFALRLHLEVRGAQVVGSVGILIRAYKQNLLDEPALKHAIDALFDQSSLHLSGAFRKYVYKLLTGI